METSEIKKQMKKKPKKNKRVSVKSLLSTGSTLLNLALSGKARGGFRKGMYYFIVGDSESGKTFYSLTCLAEATLTKHFKDYRFIFDPVEDGALMDMEKFFGPTVAEKLEFPAYDEKGKGVPSRSIEDFYFNLDDAIEQGEPFIYILDSMDGLGTSGGDKKFREAKEAKRKGKKVAGSYGDVDKAKENSQGIRRSLKSLKKLGAILIVISQTRDNIGYGFEKKTRSGGHALRFYAMSEIWTSTKGQLFKTVRGKKRHIGMLGLAKIKKNRGTGQRHTIEIPFYHSYGFDDIGSCIDYLIDEEYWKTSGKKIIAPELEFKGSREALIKKIEDEDLVKDLRSLVEELWKEIDAAMDLKRKPRYG